MTLSAKTGSKRAQTWNGHKPTVYWVHASGRIMIAPHPDWRCDYGGWQRFEAHTAREKETLSRRMAAQEEAKLRDLQIQDHLRLLPRWERTEAYLRIHRANGYASQADQIACERIQANISRRKELLYGLVSATTGDVSASCFTYEKEEEKTGMAQYANRKSQELG